MTENLSIWDRFADIDPAFTKKITGKAYQGTSPNPQYVIRCLTEIFGPVGKGFGWEVLHEGFEPLGDEILHWCRIRFWHTERSNFFESYGQTKALMKTSNGLKSDEDAPKKSLTDAIIKAASHVGIAANIFLGRWDDQKYVQSVADDFREKEGPPRKANGKPETGWREDGTKTSYALKNEGSWEAVKAELDEDAVDCDSLLKLERLKGIYREKARERHWNKQFLDGLTHEFNTIERQIMEALDAADLSAVPLDKALRQSIAQHPVNGG